MLYAICENGGMENERVRMHNLYESKFEAQKEALRLWFEEMNYVEQYDADPGLATQFDVVGVHEDGTITTEI